MEKCIVICNYNDKSDKVEEYKYVLFQCFTYFEKYFTTTMKTEDEPTIPFSKHIFVSILNGLFHSHFTEKCNGTIEVAMSDIVPIHDCCQFLGAKTDLGKFMENLIVAGSGSYSDNLAEIIKLYKIDIRSKIVDKLNASDIVNLLEIPKHNENVNKLVEGFSTAKLYSIYKLTDTGFGMYWTSIGKASPNFNVEDFKAMFNYMSSCVASQDIGNLKQAIQVLKYCRHLTDNPELKKYWEIIHFISRS